MQPESISPTPLSSHILAAAAHAWNSSADLRMRRDRCKRFTYGDQWSDITYDNLSLRGVTESEKARRRGQTPMTNNLIRRLVRCIVGRFRMILAEQAQSSDESTDSLHLINDIDEIDSRTLEEFLISGCAIQKVSSERRPYGDGTWVDIVSPDRFFVNSICDPCSRDIELIGMIHDMSFSEVLMRFSRSSNLRASQLNRLYQSDSHTAPSSSFDSRDRRNDFFTPRQGRCRVFEVWTLEASQMLRCHDMESASVYDLPTTDSKSIDIENKARAEASRLPIEVTPTWQSTWHCRWLGPDGSILDEYTAPRHPFVVKLYPLIDGEVHSLVEDVIDQQIYINRLITLVDHVMGSSAKGVLLFPVSQKVAGSTWEDIARKWASPDGIIPLNGHAGLPEPRQISASGADGGAKELLRLQMQMFEDVSGVSNALMGRSSLGGNAGVERYEAEVRNATISILDLLDSFAHFRRQRDLLISNFN